MRREPKGPRVVLDTNVLFSALALPNPDSPPLRILELARAGEIEAVVSPFIMGELEKNLSRKAAWDETRLAALRRKLRAFLTVIVPTSRISAIQRVEADNRILECALDARADALVTGNMKDLRPLGSFRGIAVLTPREFLAKHFPGS